MATNFGHKARIIGFSADVFEPQHPDFQTIFDNNGLAFYDLPPHAINKAQLEGQVANVFDHYHWNENGH